MLSLLLYSSAHDKPIKDVAVHDISTVIDTTTEESIYGPIAFPTGNSTNAMSFTSSKHQRSLLNEIDDDCSKLLCQSWTVTLPFKVYQCQSSELINTSSMYLEVDLFSLTSNVLGGGQIARFDPAQYPVVPGTMKDNEACWNKLATDLMKVSLEKGNCALVARGSYGTSKQRVALECFRSRKYRQNATKPQSGGNYRKSSINLDARNARGGTGKSQKKRTSTHRALTENEESTCKARIVIGIDSNSFFVVGGAGNNCHEGHPPQSKEDIPSRKRYISGEATQQAKVMALHGARPGLIAAVIKENYGVSMTRRQSSSLTQHAKLASSLIGAENLEKYQHCTSDTDRVFEYLKSIDASYIALYHQNGDCNPELPRQKKQENEASSSKLIIETAGFGGDTRVTEVEETGANETNEEVMNYAVSTRGVVGAADNQTVLVALVWTTPQGKQYFQAFPEQVSVDGTHDTTKDGWELITISVQDMNGGQETVLRCWAPNNRNWFFRWLFQTAVPTLVGRRACEKTELVICDGDPQECGQLDAAIIAVFVNAIRRRCGWHIVDRAWNNHIGQNLGGRSHPKREQIKNLVQTIKNWLYSMMKDIETPKEYQVYVHQ